jgi:hypothetical protein
LIAFVEGQAPEGGSLDRVTAAVAAAESLGAQADALIGHFIDRARRSGASWSQIGQSMGVTKQAAQKWFVPRFDGSDPIPEAQRFGRFTDRSRATVSAAARLADAAPVDDRHLLAAVPVEPAGFAMRILADAGISPDELATALDLPTPVSGPTLDLAGLRDVEFTEEGWSALRGALKAALRLGHNYIGTEHLLLGLLYAGGPAAAALTARGVTADAVESAVQELLAAYLAQRDRERAE